jgi:tRNA dimethylallyltransferase
VASEVASKIGGDVISCDSMQIYRDMDIITQAHPPEGAPGVKWHLIREIPPEEDFSAAVFVQRAERCIRKVTGEGKIPVLEGGTGLYIKALLDGLSAFPPADESFREKIRRRIEEQGLRAFYDELREIDPDAASRIHPNDSRRIIRALEICHLSGKTVTELREVHGTGGMFREYECILFGLRLPRSLLYDRINRLVENMFSDGLVAEVRDLRTRSLSHTASKALGIKEAGMYIDGKITLSEAREELKKNTRRYAKRQMTWFRKDGRIKWIDADRPPGDIADDILEEIDNARRGRHKGQ